MFGFHSGNTGSSYGAIIDIASGTIGIGIVASRKGDPLPHLIYSHRASMRISEHTGEEENLRRIREVLLSACLLLSQEGNTALRAYDRRARITKLFVTCSSPWSYTIARNVHYESDEPFEVTPSIINDLVQSAEAEMVSHVQEISKTREGGFEIVESATVDIHINDYPVHSPLRQKGVSLELSHIAGLIPTEILEALHEVQDKLFPNTELRTHTYMLIMYCVLRDLFPRLSSSCIIDVTGEATEFGIVENNLLIENTFVGVGSSSFVRSIMETTKKPVTDIHSIIQEFDDTDKAFPNELKENTQAYIDAVITAIDNITTRRIFPTNVIFTTHKPYEKMFKRMITVAVKKATGKDINIITVSPEVIDAIATGEEHDVYLALGARFFHKLHGCAEPNPE